jgi:hypothetical protein
MMYESTLSQLLLEALGPGDANFAVHFAVAMQTHRHLPHWLRHCAKFAPVDRQTMLERAARTFESQLPDYVAAQVLNRLAHDPDLFQTVLRALEDARAG